MILNRKFFTLASLSILAVGTLTIVKTPNLQAVSANDWSAGNIIDDAVFTDSNSMSVSEIQNWLDTRLSNCDSSGSHRSELRGGIDYDRNGTITRSEYGRSIGNPAPFTCLNNYYEVPKATPGPSIPNSNYGKSTIPRGAKSAAQLIYDAARTYDISPKVLLVKLGTESAGPLTSDTWPLKRQYLYAMGAHCPDSGAGGSPNCDSDYAGFSLQMLEGAKLLRWYLNNVDESWWPYRKPYQKNHILWNIVESNCGGSSVYIESKATATLYTYTPYQPNRASLEGYPGYGDRCSSYGNRNFWFVFNNWFGSTSNPQVNVSSIQIPDSIDTSNPTTVTFKVRNVSNKTLHLGRVKVVARSASNENYDFDSVSNVSILPGKTFTYQKNRVLDEEGTYTFTIGRHKDGRWQKPPFAEFSNSKKPTTTKLAVNKPTITQGITLDGASHAGKQVRASYTVKNNSTIRDVYVGRTKIAVRDENGRNYDFPSSGHITLRPGQEYTFTRAQTLPHSGTYTLWLANYRSGGPGWSRNFPKSSSSDITRNTQITLKEPVTLTAPVTVTPTGRTKDSVRASFKIKNNSDTAKYIGRLKIAVRDKDGNNVDFVSSNHLTLQPGEEYTYSKQKIFSASGDYTFWLANYRRNDGWSRTYPSGENNTISRKGSFNLKPSVSVTTSSIPSNSSANSPVRATFTIKNHHNRTVDIGRVKIAVRDKNNRNRDFISSGHIILQPGEQYTYSSTRTFNAKGVYRFWIANRHPDRGWDNEYPIVENSSIRRSGTMTIR